MIVLTDSQTAIAVIRKAGKTGKARTEELRKVMRKIKQEKKALGCKAVSIGWVKAYIRIKGNEEADKRAKLGTDEEDPTFPVIIQRGL